MRTICRTVRHTASGQDREPQEAARRWAARRRDGDAAAPSATRTRDGAGARRSAAIGSPATPSPATATRAVGHEEHARTGQARPDAEVESLVRAGERAVEHRRGRATPRCGRGGRGCRSRAHPHAHRAGPGRARRRRDRPCDRRRSCSRRARRSRPGRPTGPAWARRTRPTARARVLRRGARAPRARGRCPARAARPHRRPRAGSPSPGVREPGRCRRGDHRLGTGCRRDGSRPPHPSPADHDRERVDAAWSARRTLPECAAGGARRACAHRGARRGWRGLGRA